MIFNDSKYNKDWDIKALSELGSFKRGKSKHRPRNDDVLFVDGQYPLVQTGEIKEANLFIRNHTVMYNDFGLRQSKLWDTNTLCITIAANIAETALLSYPMCFPDSVVGFNAFTGESSEIFMHYVFTYIKGSIQNAASGSIQDNINVEFLTGLNFRVPKKDYQDKIVNILSALDFKIELNNRINAELEAMAKTVYDYWFVQFDFPNAEGKPYRTEGGKMVWNEELKRDIPEGWEVDKLGNHIKLERGVSYKSGDISDIGRPMINLNSFYLNGTYKPSGIKYFTGEINESKLLKAGDLLIATTDVTRNAYIIGKSFILPDVFENQVLVASCDVAKISIGGKLDKHYLDMLFKSDFYHKYIKGYASGTLVLHLDTKGIEWYQCILPSRAILDSYSSIKENIEKRKSIVIKENQQLTQLRDWLLPMLMNGQVKVN